MASKKISQLPILTSPNLSGVTAIVQSGITYQTTLDSIKNTLSISGSGNFFEVQETCWTYSDASIWGTTNLTGSLNHGDDDNFYEISLPWSVTFLGKQYDTIYLSSNSYLTFVSGSRIYYIPYPHNIPYPAIFVASGDNGLENYYYGVINNGGNNEFRIRYEGWNSTDGNQNEYGIIWEAVFPESNTDQIDIVIDKNLRNPGGVYGISDGERWIDQIAGLPIFDSKTASDVYAIKISPVITSDATILKITGPGVITETISGSIYVNVDPISQYGLGIDYTGDVTILSSTRYSLELTTGEQDSSISISPNGLIDIRPKKVDNSQLYNGFSLSLHGGDASNSGSFNGGDVIIGGGQKVGNGTNGKVIIESETIISNGDLNVTGSIYGNYFYGNGSTLSNLPKVKDWIENSTVSILNDETVVISGDMVLNNSNLYLAAPNNSITIGNLTFEKKAKIFIGGYLLINDSNIHNDGLISVGGAVIMVGNSTITGTGTII